MDANDILLANPEFVAREIAGEYILIPVGQAAVSFNGLASLNETGYYLWGLLQNTVAYGALLNAFTAEYELEPDEAARDLSEFLQPLLSRGLVSRSPAAK